MANRAFGAVQVWWCKTAVLGDGVRNLAHAAQYPDGAYRQPLGACLAGMVDLKSKIQYLVLAGFFFAALLISFSPFQLMVGRYAVSPFWCLSIPVLGILLTFLLSKESFNTFALPKRLPLFVGGLIAIIHFTIFYIWFDSPPEVCSGSSFLSAFPLAPTYLLTVLPIAPVLLGIIRDLFRIDLDFFSVFISSCYDGVAGGLLVTTKITGRWIGLTLIGISILAGVFSILEAIGTGCGA